MLRLFVERPLAPQGGGAEFELDAAAARHVQVRRLQPGDALLLFDGHGGEWLADVAAMGRSRVAVRLGAHQAVQREPHARVTLAVGMPANERMDWLVEKAAELGAWRIVPLLGERSVLRLAGERAARRRAHWQAVAVAAAEQSGATRVTELAEVAELRTWLAGLGGEGGRRWLLSPDAAPAPAPALPATHDALFLSGPEGGFSDAEEAAALAAGFTRCSLGTRVLRAETAPLVALAQWLGRHA